MPLEVCSARLSVDAKRDRLGIGVGRVDRAHAVVNIDDGVFGQGVLGPRAADLEGLTRPAAPRVGSISAHDSIVALRSKGSKSTLQPASTTSSLQGTQ